MITSLSVACATLAVAIDGDWPHYRGPAQNGTTDSSVFESGQFTLDVAWSLPLGSGYSGVTVADGLVFTMGNGGAADVLVAVDAESGVERWRQPIGAAYKGHDGSADGPVSTPIVADDAIIALSPWGVLTAHECDDGRVRWRHDLVAEFDAAVPEYGFATTPVVDGTLVILQIGGPDGHGLGAFELATGDLAWSTGDEAVEYQSPSLLTLAGRRQVVAFRADSVHGHDPQTGESLWSLELGPRDISGTGMAAALDDHRFFALTRGGLLVFELRATEDGFEVETGLRSRDFGGTYVPPVYHDGHFYGFRGDFLSCVDAATGRRKWKSRPPGGKGLILVRDRLVVFGALGRAVVVAATPDGYREEAALEVFDGSAFTWPSFADGRILLRNTEALAAVRVVSGSDDAVAAAASPASDRLGHDSAFGRFVTALPESDDPAGMIDAFLAEHPAMPLVEGDLVHFVYVGDASDVAIRASMIDASRPESLARVDGTNLFHRTYRIDPASRAEYAFQIDLEQVVTDPRNPSDVPGPYRPQRVSEVVMPNYEAGSFAEHAPRPGRLETMTWRSALLGHDREVAIYLPRAYDSARTRNFDLLLVQDGSEWRENADLVSVLDHVCERSAAPVVAAFIDPIDLWWFEAGGSQTREYVDALADELVPELDRRYRLRDGAAHRAVVGATHHGLTAIYAAFHRPDVFGKAAARSIALQHGAEDRLMALVADGAVRPARLYVDWNLYESVSVDQGVDYRADSLALVAALETHGHPYRGGEVSDAHGWTSWGIHSDRMLEALFPRDEAE